MCLSEILIYNQLSVVPFGSWLFPCIYNNVDCQFLHIIGANNHLLNIKENFKGKNLGFFLRDNFWVIVPNKKQEMNENDLSEYGKIDFSIMKLNEKIVPTEYKYSEYFGWCSYHKLNIPSKDFITILKINNLKKLLQFLYTKIWIFIK